MRARSLRLPRAVLDVLPIAPPSLAVRCTQRLLHTSRPLSKIAESGAAQLTKQVNALVGRRDAAGAVAAVRGALRRSSELLPATPAGAPASADADNGAGFPWAALSATLFACAECGEARLGLGLVEEVRQRFPGSVWTDESVLAVLLRLQCSVADGHGARQLFTCLLQSNLLRPRTASIYLQFTCDVKSDTVVTQADRDFVFAVYEQCLQRGIELSIADYVSLGRFCVRYGSEPLSSLFFILAEMQGHVAEVSQPFLSEVVEPWCAQHPEQSRTTRVRVPCGLSEATTAGSSSSLASVCCPSCQQPLAGYPFTAANRTQLLTDLVETVVPQKCRTRRASAGFEAWRRYITQREECGDGVDLLIDGANLGYYGLSSWYALAKRALLLRRGLRESEITESDLDFDTNCKKSRKGVDVGVNFELIDLALQVAVGGTRAFRRPLVILHERHCEARNMTDSDAAYAHKWREKGWLYCTPTGVNDDLCWLYAALELTSPSEPGLSEHGRGRTVYVLTNDLMRDHHFTLLSPRSFTRWREQHQIKFRCSYLQHGKTELSFVWPSPFTRCIQQAGQGWHLPYLTEQEAATGETGASDEGTNEEQPTEQTGWLCLTVP